jgi:hypothetical protein
MVLDYSSSANKVVRMRSGLVIALWIATQFSAFANEGKAEKNGGKQHEGIITRVGQEKADKGNRREFQIDFEFSMEQQDKNGDIIVEGKTIPGSTQLRIKSTLPFSDGELFVYPHISVTGETKGHRYSTDEWIEIKVTSITKDLIQLSIAAKQSRSEPLEAGLSRSWNLSLEAAKTVKLGKEFKLEFGDEKILGTKCTFEGVIQAKDQEKK